MDLITLAEVKAYSNINSTTQDSSISLLIPKVSQMIKNYCGRTFIDYYSSPKVEVVNITTNSIFVQELPLNVVSSLEYSADYGKTYILLTEFIDYVINKQDETLDIITDNVYSFSTNGLRLTYTGGYASTPEDLKLAAMDLVSYYLRSDMAVKSTRTPGSSSTQVEYVMNATLPSHIRRILDTYRLIL